MTETQKARGRVHEIPAALIEGLFGQFENRRVATNGLGLELRAPVPREAGWPRLPEFHQRDAGAEDLRGRDSRAGFSLDLWLAPEAVVPGEPLLDSRDGRGQGLAVAATAAGTIRLTLNDGRQQAAWESDRGAWQTGRPQHLVLTVDGGPKIITFVVNGVLGDGGEDRQFGWGRFSPTLRAPNGGGTVKLSPAVRCLRLYDRALRTSEAVGNHAAGP
ncbi:MAG: LamG domain-containing protein [Verrucomicrobia bacterium]|nr:LamG domain-containing protein [Verrucomicrobiota bacterium]